MTNKLRYKLLSRMEGYASNRTLLARCRYQPWRYLLLPFSLIIAYIRRKVEALRCRHSIDYTNKGIIRPIAFYLPQFHQIPENDEWWGNGFTEWTNVRKAQPLFKGHYQPHVPHPDIGYYDLSDVNVMKKQAAIAKKYGIYGFCFYYYYFKNGKRLLETPIDNWLAHPEIDLPFCFCWANENWTRAWDGGDREVLMPQDYGLDNMERMVRGMIPAFKDERYIKVDGKPMLLVYRPEIIPGVENMVPRWREITKDAGFSDIHLVMVQNFCDESPLKFGFDVATEFAVPRTKPLPICEGPDIDIETFDGERPFVRYCAVRAHYRAMSGNADYTRYKCVAPGWDCSPRRGNRATLIADADPVQFGRFLDEAFAATLSDSRLRKDGIVFINAWNEWGEGAHLEPDEKYGYENLEQVQNAVERFLP